MAWVGALILLLALAYIPASMLAATRSWRRAWDALRQYLKIMLAFAIVGGGIGLAMAIAEHGLPFIGR